MTRTAGGQHTRTVVVGATLVGAATILGVAGLAMELVAAVSAMRRRIAEQDTTARGLARRQWDRYRATVRAAGDAWRDEATTGSPIAPNGAAAATRRTAPERLGR